jgi:hypothetical protein
VACAVCHAEHLTLHPQKIFSPSFSLRCCSVKLLKFKKLLDPAGRQEKLYLYPTAPNIWRVGVHSLHGQEIAYAPTLGMEKQARSLTGGIVSVPKEFAVTDKEVCANYPTQYCWEMKNIRLLRRSQQSATAIRTNVKKYMGELLVAFVKHESSETKKNGRALLPRPFP